MISNKLKDKKVTKIQRFKQANLFILQLKYRGLNIVNDWIKLKFWLAVTFFILLLSSYIFWIRNKQKQRITWKQMHWFLVEQSSANLKNILNICMYKLSFCYFCHDEINDCWDGKLQIRSQKSNTPKSHRHNYTLLLCYSISSLE